MAGVRKEPRNGKFQGWYIDHTGKRVYFTGTNKKATTRDIAERFQAREDEIKLGYRKPPDPAVKNASRPYQEVLEEYLAWGNCQGGLNGRSWSRQHAKERKNELVWWKAKLDIETMDELVGSLPRVEVALRKLLEGDEGKKETRRSRLTVKQYGDCLKSFCNWARERGFLETDPLSGMATLDGTPESTRRALTPDEVNRIMEVAPEDRRLLYEVALTTGLRVVELRALTPDCVDTELGVLRLDAAWTKNRRSSLMPIPEELIHKLVEHADKKQAIKLYQLHYGRRGEIADNIPSNPLLYVNSHTAHALHKDLQAAGIPKFIDGEGKVDFHSLRFTFITSLIEAGANLKEAQELARHSNPSLTMNVYAKTRKENLASLVNRVAKTLPSQTKRVTGVSNGELDESDGSANSLSTSAISSMESLPRHQCSTWLPTGCLIRCQAEYPSCSIDLLPAHTKSSHYLEQHSMEVEVLPQTKQAAIPRAEKMKGKVIERRTEWNPVE